MQHDNERGAPGQEGAPGKLAAKLATEEQSSAAPAIPRCHVRCRLDALDELETAVLNDALATFDDIVAIGWDRADAVDLLTGGYANWVTGRIRDAIDLAAVVAGADQ